MAGGYYTAIETVKDYGEYLDSLQMTAYIDDFKPIYIQRIGDATVKFGGIQFRDLLDSDGVTILPSKDLTIGSFAFNIVSTDRNNDIDEPDQFRASPKKSMM